MTTAEIFLDGLDLFAVADPSFVEPGQTRAITHALNGALQEIDALGGNWVNRKPVTANTVASQNYLDLSGVRTVLGDVTVRDGQNPTPIAVAGNLRDFWRGETPPEAVLGLPARCLPRMEHDAAVENASPLRVYLWPVPDRVYPVTFHDVRVMFPTFTTADLENIEEPPVIPLPNGWGASVLLPLFRLRLSSSQYFGAKDALQQFAAEASTARGIISAQNPNRARRGRVLTPPGY